MTAPGDALPAMLQARRTRHRRGLLAATCEPFLLTVAVLLLWEAASGSAESPLISCLRPRRSPAGW